MPLVKRGTKRFCLPKTVVQGILLLHRNNNNAGMIRSLLWDQDKIVKKMVAEAGTADVRVDQAIALVNQFGFTMVYQPLLKNPMHVFKRKAGLYLLICLLTYTDGDTDKHALLYDSEASQHEAAGSSAKAYGRLMDCQRYVGGREQGSVLVYDHDAAELPKAIAALEGLYDTTRVHVKEVYLLD